MRHWLMITTVDVMARPNNREHQLLRHLSGRFEQTTVVFRRRCAYGSLRQRLRDALVPSVEIIERGSIRYVAVNPPLNHYEGMVREAVAAGRSDPSWTRRLLSAAIAVGAGPVGIVKDMATIASLAVAAARHHPGGNATLCTALGPWAAAAARILYAGRKVGAWIYEDRDYEPGFIGSPMRKGWARRMENSGIRAANAAITIGGRLARLRQSESGRSPFLIPTGADRARVPDAPLRRDPVLVYIGNVATWSGLEEVVRALPEIRRAVPAARVVVLGDGTASVVDRLKRTAVEQGVADALDLVPGVPHNEVLPLLLRSAIGLAVFEPTPLRVFAMPLKVVEYMSAGLPVLATVETEAADVVRDHRCGIAVEPTANEIARAAIRLLGNSSVWQACSRNGFAASADFDWAVLMEREWDVMRRASQSKGFLDAELPLALDGARSP